MEVGGYNMPDELHYHKEHGWAKVEEDGKVRIGMNDMFQSTAGDIVYVDLPFEGDDVSANEVCGKIQSAKWIGKLYSPISGEVVGVNEELDSDCTLINSDPYGEGWLIKLELSAPSDLDSLMSDSEYEQYVEKLKGEQEA